MDRDERLMAVLGSRMLEDRRGLVRRRGHRAAAGGRKQHPGNVALSRERVADPSAALGLLVELDGGAARRREGEQVLLQLNTDFSAKGLASQDLRPLSPLAGWSDQPGHDV